jgi:prepilin-type N-terminal cleavage/methylation domain-containing protein
MQTHPTRRGFTLIELVIVVTVLAVLAKMLVTTSESMSRMTATGTIEGVLQGEGEEALRSIVDDLRRSGFVTVDDKVYPHVFDDGAPTDPDFLGHAHVAAPVTARANDPDFGPQRSIVFVVPSDLDGNDRPELDADLDGWPELDGDGDGLVTDDPATGGLVWSHAEISYVVVVLVDGSRVLQRRIGNDPATARVVARHVERVQFDTPESAAWQIPLGSVRVRLFFRAPDSDGRIYRSRHEVTVRLRNT